MKILVLGAGLQGSACASILARDDFAQEVILADYNQELVNRVIEKIGSSKLKGAQVDATKVDKVAKLAEGCDVVIDFVLPWMATYVMKAALKVKAHYVNTAYDDPYWEELTEGKELSLDKEFREAGLSAVLGCGGLPGYLNACIAKYANEFDTIDSIYMRGGFKFKGEVPRIGEWNPGWAPKQALIDFLTEPIIFEDGSYKKEEIFSGQEDFDFGGELGEIFLAYHSHEEAYSLPYSYKGKGIMNCCFKYPVDVQAATFIYQGFVPENEIEINGQKVKPFDVLCAMLPQPGESFFVEQPPVSKECHILGGTEVDIEGTQNGKKVTCRISVPFSPDDMIKTYEVCGTCSVDVALPAVTGAKMCAEGVRKGISFVEMLDPDRFLEIINEKLAFMPKMIFKK